MTISPRPFALRSALRLLCGALFLAACSGETNTRTHHSVISFDPVALDFGRQDAGASRLRTFQVKNLGTSDLVIDKAEIQDDARHAFALADVPATVPAGTEATVSVTYLAPLEEGPDGARVVFGSNADNAPEAQVSLAGRSELPCGPGKIFCDGSCFDPQTDSAHCGKCDVACAAPEQCVQGSCACVPKTCEALGATCGDVSDGCGQTLHCGGCTGTDECFENRCVQPSCRDGRTNGTETDLDCGGATCPPCAATKACRANEDCGGGLVCLEGRCAPCGEKAQCPRGLVCSAAGICGACAKTSDCDQDEACVGGKCLACPSEAAFNECGLCAGPPVPLAGQNCVASSGCVSSYACNGTKNGVVCTPVPVNACGLCGGPEVTGVGSRCTLPNGCGSTLACNDLKSGTVCQPVAKNQCGVCGGPNLPQVGQPCVTSDGCQSSYACSADGAGVVCSPVQKNECGLCGGPAVTGLGADCTSAASGCASKVVCNDAKTAAVCQPLLKNECGLCGGSPVSGIGNSCTLANGCVSTLGCNDQKSGTVCQSVTKNQCGLCGGPAVSDLGQSCTSSAGCSSTKVCNSAGDGSVCDTANQNACGLCSGPVINDLGASCTDSASGCASKTVCKTDKSGTVCQSVTKNACQKCGGATITNLGANCVNSAGCAGTYVCDSTGDGTVCNAPTSCSTPPATHLVISEVSGWGLKGSNDEFIELYNPTSSTVDARLFHVWYRAKTCSPWIDLVQLSGAGAKGQIPSHRFVLLSFSSSSYFTETSRVLPDYFYNSANIDAYNGSVAVTTGSSAPASSTGSNVVDLVGYGSQSCGAEGTYSDPPTVAYDDSSIVRKAYATSSEASMIVFPKSNQSVGADAAAGSGYDSGDNSVDFVNRDKRDPQNSASAAQP